MIQTKGAANISNPLGIDHPGVVGILDTGDLPDGKPYLVMQYVDGVTLRSVMTPEGMDLEPGPLMR